MKRCWIYLLFVPVLGAAVARGETNASRPTLDGVEPVATCKLQTLADHSANTYAAQSAMRTTLQPLPEDPLANYERTPLGLKQANAVWVLG